MLYFLQESVPVKKLAPAVGVIKEQLKEKEDKLTQYIDKTVDALVAFAPSLISAMLVLLVGMWLIKRIAILAQKSMAKRDIDVSLRTFLRSLISIGLKIILIVTVAGMMGIGTASFVTILGAAGLAVGLALQGSLSNFAGGVLILIFKPFRVGDSIEAGGQSGEVIEIQIFNTVLLTGEHKTVILPNGQLSNGTIINNTRYGDIRLDIALVVSSDSDLDRVEQIIEEILGNEERVLKTPKAGVFIGRSADGGVAVNVKPYCLNSGSGELASDLYKAFKVAFEKNGIKGPVQERRIRNLN